MTTSKEVKNKEVLHTQGEWDWKQERGNNVYEYIITAKNGRLLVAKLEAFEDDEIEEVKANAELICKAVNAYGKPKMFPQSPVPIPSDEYIEKCVNNYERLIDSNRELLAILEQEAWLGNINLDKHIAAINKAKAIL